MSRPRVLVIDDDATVRAAVSSALSGEGYDVDWFGDAEEALRQALASPPASWSWTSACPSLDGWELCEILRRQSQTRDVPVLFLTGRTDVRDRITAMQVGGSDFISKPFHARDLRAKVRALVGGEPGRCHWEAVGRPCARGSRRGDGPRPPSPRPWWTSWSGSGCSAS